MVCLAAAVSFTAPASAAVNLVSNGDFEAGFSSWHTFPGHDIAPIKGAAYVANAGGTGSAAAQANTMASFGAGQKANASLLFANAFNTVAGQVYTLSFDYAIFGAAGASETLTYSIYGDGIDGTYGTNGTTTTQAAGKNLDTIFKTYTTSFMGSGHAANIAFTAIGQPTINVDGLLDNVSVVAAVPEASTWAMMFLGFGAIGATLRRRRATTAMVAA